MSHSHAPIYLTEQIVPGKRLGRGIIEHPESNRAHPVEPLLREVELGVRNPLSKVWYRRGIFNQYQTSTCVAQATSGVMMTHPFIKSLSADQRKQLVDPDFRIHLYRMMQAEDEWEGAEPEYYGTSTNGGMRGLRAAGFIKGWKWCFGIQDVLSTLRMWGPVAIGTWWYDSFDSPRSDGRISIAKSATKRGGHETEIVSVNEAARTVRGINSWGDDWGDHGRFEMTFDTLDALLSDEGEAATVVV